MHRPNTERVARGMTLVELLVVIIIVGLLITIGVTTLSGVMTASHRAATQQAMNALQGAIDRYYTDHGAHPGPLSDNTLFTGTGTPNGVGGSGFAVTSSENLVLGLLGGLGPDPGAPGFYRFYADRVGRGPLNFSPERSAPPAPYIERGQVAEILSAGRFADTGGRQANDTDVPELVDRFDVPLPLLYLRARRGAPGIMSDGTQARGYHYDLRQMLPYTATSIGGAGTHGLRTLGDENNIADFSGPAPSPALPYFRQPGSGTTNLTGSPRQKDRYILISAGKDRLYGTPDDLVTGGLE